MKNVEFSSKLERAHTTQFQAKSRILGEQAAAAATTKKKKNTLAAHSQHIHPRRRIRD